MSEALRAHQGEDQVAEYAGGDDGAEYEVEGHGGLQSRAERDVTDAYGETADAEDQEGDIGHDGCSKGGLDGANMPINA
jgi:hypothetical protein